ncbi:MAG: hypothetical protein MZU91_02980 [Desulfosudis oleivorans]|nr:hypothetical protein [Desulfosudis oleivorans]
MLAHLDHLKVAQIIKETARKAPARDHLPHRQLGHGARRASLKTWTKCSKRRSRPWEAWKARSSAASRPWPRS